MIRHILLIAFKPGTQPARIDVVRNAFLAIPHQVSGVTAVEWGKNDSPEGRDDGFTHSVLMTFADEAARQRYQPHPDHDALKAIFRPVLERIIVLDYTLQVADAVTV
ncbi:TPA: Dabb family protein [Aeromonas veronii]